MPGLRQRTCQERHSGLGKSVCDCGVRVGTTAAPSELLSHDDSCPSTGVTLEQETSVARSVETVFGHLGDSHVRSHVDVSTTVGAEVLDEHRTVRGHLEASGSAFRAAGKASDGSALLVPWRPGPGGS